MCPEIDGRGTEAPTTRIGASGKAAASPPAPLPEGEGGRKMRGEVTTDPVQDAVWMVHDLVVGQTKDDITSSRKPSVAASVTQRLGEVRRAIRFDDEARFLAEEVDNEWSDGMLSAELGLHDLPTAQHAPKLLFSGCGSGSQSTRLEGPGSQQAGHAFVSALRPNRLLPFPFPAPLSLRERGGGVRLLISRMPRPALRVLSCWKPSLPDPATRPDVGLSASQNFRTSSS